MDDIAPHVPHSELLLAAKAEGLLRLGKHERAREFCGQAVHLDEGPHREVSSSCGMLGVSMKALQLGCVL